MKKKLISGEYNRYGYTVNDGDTAIYSATNHRQDSGQAAYTERDRMTIREIRSACIATCKEMAAAQNAKYIGVERVVDDR